MALIPPERCRPERPEFNRADLQQSSPGILGKPCPDLVLICGLDDVQTLLAVADRAAQE
jgi:hypothetical protein